MFMKRLHDIGFDMSNVIVYDIDKSYNTFLHEPGAQPFIRLWNFGTPEFKFIEDVFNALNWQHIIQHFYLFPPEMKPRYKPQGTTVDADDTNRGNRTRSFGLSSTSVTERDPVTGLFIPALNVGTLDRVELFEALSELMIRALSTSRECDFDSVFFPNAVDKVRQTYGAGRISPSTLLEALVIGTNDGHLPFLFAHLDLFNDLLDCEFLCASSLYLAQYLAPNTEPFWCRFFISAVQKKCAFDLMQRIITCAPLIFKAQLYYQNCLDLSRQFILPETFFCGGVKMSGCHMHESDMALPVMCSPSCADSLQRLSAVATYLLFLHDHYHLSEWEMCQLIYCSLISKNPCYFGSVAMHWIHSQQLPDNNIPIHYIDECRTMFGFAQLAPGSPSLFRSFLTEEMTAGQIMNSCTTCLQVLQQYRTVPASSPLQRIREQHSHALRVISSSIKCNQEVAYDFIVLFVMVNLLHDLRPLHMFTCLQPSGGQSKTTEAKIVKAVAFRIGRPTRIASKIIHDSSSICESFDYYLPCQAIMFLGSDPQREQGKSTKKDKSEITLSAKFCNTNIVWDYRKMVKEYCGMASQSSGPTRRRCKSVQSARHVRPDSICGRIGKKFWSHDYHPESDCSKGSLLFQRWSRIAAGGRVTLNPFQGSSLLTRDVVSKIRTHTFVSNERGWLDVSSQCNDKQLSFLHLRGVWRDLDITQFVAPERTELLQCKHAFPGCTANTSVQGFWQYILTARGEIPFVRRDWKQFARSSQQETSTTVTFLDPMLPQSPKLNGLETRMRAVVDPSIPINSCTTVVLPNTRSVAASRKPPPTACVRKRSVVNNKEYSENTNDDCDSSCCTTNSNFEDMYPFNVKPKNGLSHPEGLLAATDIPEKDWVDPLELLPVAQDESTNEKHNDTNTSTLSRVPFSTAKIVQQDDIVSVTNSLVEDCIEQSNNHEDNVFSENSIAANEDDNSDVSSTSGGTTETEVSETLSVSDRTSAKGDRSQRQSPKHYVHVNHRKRRRYNYKKLEQYMYRERRNRVQLEHARSVKRIRKQWNTNYEVINQLCEDTVSGHGDSSNNTTIFTSRSSRGVKVQKPSAMVPASGQEKVSQEILHDKATQQTLGQQCVVQLVQKQPSLPKDGCVPVAQHVAAHEKWPPYQHVEVQQHTPDECSRIRHVDANQQLTAYDNKKATGKRVVPPLDTRDGCGYISILRTLTHVLGCDASVSGLRLWQLESSIGKDSFKVDPVHRGGKVPLYRCGFPKRIVELLASDAVCSRIPCAADLLYFMESQVNNEAVVGTTAVHDTDTLRLWAEEAGTFVSGLFCQGVCLTTEKQGDFLWVNKDAAVVGTVFAFLLYCGKLGQFTSELVRKSLTRCGFDAERTMYCLSDCKQKKTTQVAVFGIESRQGGGGGGGGSQELVFRSHATNSSFTL